MSMFLRLTAGEPDSDGFVAGYTAKLELNGTDVSQHVSRINVSADAEDGPLRATIELFLTGMQIEVPAEVQALIDEAGKSATLGGGLTRIKA